MKKSYLLILLIVIAVIAASYVYAAKGTTKAKATCAPACSDLCSSECTAGMGYGFGPKGLAGVKPSASQVKKLKSIHADFVVNTKTARASIQTKMKSLAKLWSSGKGSESAVKSLINGIEKDRATVRNAAVASTFKAINVLDSKQKAKLRASVANGYVHLISIGTRMNAGAAVTGKKAKSIPACATSCPR